MAHQQVSPAPETPAADPNTDKREVSSIAFPYDDLDSAAQIALAVHQLHGSEAEVEQIAAHLKQSPKSSGFRTQIAAAKTFGLITGSQGVMTLTGLGTRICDSQQEKAARAEAFLTVELYKRIYEKFKGGVLPPDNGLETAIVSMGVAQKQKERVRQIFKRSAQQAGFFQFGTDRLVMPAIKASTPAPVLTLEEEQEEPNEEDRDKQHKPKGSGGGGEQYHPFIQGLLRKLPAPDTDWPADGRIKWLQTAANIFDLMYTNSDDDNKRSISVDFKKDSAK